MSANINIENKPVMPEQARPVLNAAAHPSKEIKTEHNNILSIELSKAKKETEEKKDPEQNLNNAVKQLNSYTQSINRNLEFNIDTDSGETIVKVIDTETDELIRQIPNKEALQLSKKLGEKLINESNESGLLLDKLQA